jgi:hypothetical protein
MQAAPGCPKIVSLDTRLFTLKRQMWPSARAAFEMFWTNWRRLILSLLCHPEPSLSHSDQQHLALWVVCNAQAFGGITPMLPNNALRFV